MSDLKWVEYTEPLVITSEPKSLSDLFTNTSIDLTSANNPKAFDWSNFSIDLTQPSTETSAPEKTSVPTEAPIDKPTTPTTTTTFDFNNYFRKGYLDYNGSDDVHFITLLRQEGIPIRTGDYIKDPTYQGFRGYNNSTAGHVSGTNHGRIYTFGSGIKTVGAYDLHTGDGITYGDLMDRIYKNPKVVQWLLNHGWGIIEEFNGPGHIIGNHRYTWHSSGNHIHVGSDELAKAHTIVRLRNYGYTIPDDIYNRAYAQLQKYKV